MLLGEGLHPSSSESSRSSSLTETMKVFRVEGQNRQKMKKSESESLNETDLDWNRAGEGPHQ